MRPRSRAALCVLVVGALSLHLAAQAQEDLPPALQVMVDTERAFAARAMAVGWKQAFLEYFSDSAIGYNDGKIGYARQQIQQSPDPPKDLQLLWDPRFGDVARSGELGFLTGPSRNILPSRDNGRPRHGAYASVWKRERDGNFRVVLDVGVTTPREPPYPKTFTRAPDANRFSGDLDDRTPPLGSADSVLNAGLRTNVVKAYRDRLAPGVRFHRPQTMPVVGEAAVLRFLASQPRFGQMDSRYSESAQSGDLGYTWGTWARPAPRGRAAGARGTLQTTVVGFYARVWVRERAGQWKVILDVLN